VAWAIAGVPELAAELGKYIEARNVNPPYLRTGRYRRRRRAGSSAPNDPSCQLIAPAGSSA
jgi:hypothetical protein